MPVSPAVPTDPDTMRRQQRMALLARFLPWFLAILLLALISTLVLLAVTSVSGGQRETARQAAADARYAALKDAKTAEDRIAGLHKAYEQASGTPIQLQIALALADEYYKLYLQDHAALDDRAKARAVEYLSRAAKIYKLAWETWPDHLLLGVLAGEGYALCLEETKEYDAALTVLREVLKRSQRTPERIEHFLHAECCYHLARIHYLRALTLESKNQDGKTDRGEAANYLGMVLTEGESAQSEKNRWRHEALFLKARLDAANPGPALPGGVPPPPPTSASPATPSTSVSPASTAPAAATTAPATTAPASK